MPSPWTQPEIDTLNKWSHLNTSDVFKAFVNKYGTTRSYDSVQKKVQALKELSKPDQESETDLVNKAVEAVMANIPGFKVPEEGLMVPTDNRVKTEIASWLADTRENYSGEAASPVDSEGASLVILLSDNHFGKKTEAFNLVVAKQRVLSVVDQVLDAAGPTDRVDEVIVVLAGDEVEGEDIYSNQNGGLECPVIYQAKAACEAYWQLVLNLRATFQCPVRIVTCPGNHGRMSKTADTRSNWDNVVYMMLATLVDASPEQDISIDLNFDDFAAFHVKGKVGVAYHYGTKHLGSPAMQVKYAGWILTKQADFFLHGHWHHWGVETYLGRPMMHNGCMCGPDDLAERMAVEEPARQGFFYVEKNKPIRIFGFAEWI